MLGGPRLLFPGTQPSGAARQVTEQYGGVMPSGKEEVSGLKGIGPYTSGAIRDRI